MIKEKPTNKYDDIINLPHHVSKKHPQMSMAQRAAQFSPFAALSGHGDAVKETERLTERKIELDEYEIMFINDRLQLVQEHINDEPEISITYFKPDKLKAGGAYLTETGIVKKINLYDHVIVMQNDVHIPIDEILSIEGDLFNAI